MLSVDLSKVSIENFQEISPTLSAPLTLTGLDGDASRAAAGQAVHLDVGSNAVINPASDPLSYMDIVNFGVAADGQFGLNSLSARVTATNGVDNLSVISVDGEVIGQVADYSDQWTLGFEFNDKATPERVSELLHALTFVNSSTDANAIEHCWITIEIGGSDNSTATADIHVTTAPDDATISRRELTTL